MNTASHPVADLKKEASRRIGKAVEVFKRECAGLRAGRAHVGLLDQVTVDAYDQSVALSQVGAINTPDSRTLMVSIWDKNVVRAAEKAIRDAGLGINPVVDGQMLRISIPPLTEERRQDLSKVASKYLEAARVAVRNARRDGNDALKKLEKDSVISKDEHHREQAAIQKMTDETMKLLDAQLKNKQREIMQI